jgi:hypothetical protein
MKVDLSLFGSDVPENRILRRIFWYGRDKATGALNIFNNELSPPPCPSLYVYSSERVIRAACTGVLKNEYRVLVGDLKTWETKAYRG